MTLVTLNKKRVNETTNYGLTTLFNEALNDFISGGTNINRFYGIHPALNTYETDQSYHLEITAPGFDKSDFKVKLENNNITISVEKKHDEEKNQKNYTKREFQFQNFERSFSLPENIDDEKIMAEYKNGILFIEIPKKIKVKFNSKEISIQ